MGQNAQHMATRLLADLSGASFGPGDSLYANTAASLINEAGFLEF